MAFVSHAQNFEDVLLWRALREVASGFYIDVGASSPDADSVTRAFYERGWRGINVEPVPETFDQLQAARPRDINLRLALSDAAGTAPFFSMGDHYTGLSTLNPDAPPRYAGMGVEAHEMVVQTETLAAVCRQHAPDTVHFLKVDVEGAERAVLQGADFTRFRPWIVLVEATEPMTTVENHAGWEPILLGAAYRFAWFDGLNRFYLAAERWDELSGHFKTPPNVFDAFTRGADEARARRLGNAEARLDAARAHLAEVRAHLARAEAEIARLAAALEGPGPEGA